MYYHLVCACNAQLQPARASCLWSGRFLISEEITGSLLVTATDRLELQQRQLGAHASHLNSVRLTILTLQQYDNTTLTP